ncbi:MAG: TM2 domain-containing protein [Pseudomonadota bacterium]
MALTTQQQMLVEQRLANDQKNPVVAYLLWFFLGGFGAHRFYLGKIGSAVGQLILFWLGIVLLFVFLIGIALLIAFTVWWIVDAFLIPGIIEEDKRALRVRISQEIEAGRVSD